MATELTDPDDDGILEFTQTAEDVDGDSLSITVELDQVNGTPQNGSDRNPQWLSYSTSEDTSGGTTDVEINVQINASELGGQGTTYTFVIEANDGAATTNCTFNLEVTSEVIDGTKLYEVGSSNDNAYERNLSTPWDISTATLNQSKSIKNYPTALFFRPDGSKLYVAFTDSDEILEYDLSNPWDISTASLNQSIPITGDYIEGLFFKTDGNKMYEVDFVNAEIYESDLSTPWDISTASLNNSVSSNGTKPMGLFFKPDGKKFYVIDSDTDKIYENGLSTAWEISTASLNQSVSTVSIYPAGLSFRPDGSKLYEIGGDDNSDEIHERNLSTPWDISTAVLNQSISTADGSGRGLVFGKK
jgi:DNA-binding beta-propeller fold protein YncE